VDFLIGILNVLIILGSLFLICIILIQRGKGGGLAGAFGGVGGSSAFGTKAGDVFTKITIGVAAGWILTAMLLVVLTNSRAGSASSGWGNDATSPSKDVSPSKSKSKSRAAGDTDLPPSSPSPATTTGVEAPLPPPPVDIPAIPDQPAKSGAPSPASPSPATKTPSTTAPSPSTATPGKTAAPSK
jgi:preprotein translocase subunit SecG